MTGELAEDELLSKAALIEAQPLADRAAQFEQLYERMLHDLERSDVEAE